MPFKPSTYNIGRDYYGPSRESPNSQWPMYTNEPSEDFYEQSNPWTTTLKAGAGLAGLGALGYVPVGNGKRVWDWYVRGARAIEEYSPGHILRTFQVSALLSPWEKSTQKAFFGPESFTKNIDQRNYFASLIQQPSEIGRLTTEGVRLEQGKLFWGTGNEVALQHAAAIRTAPGSAGWYGKGHAAIMDVPKGKTAWQYFWSSENPVWNRPDIENVIDDEGFALQIIGGKTKTQYYGRSLGAYLTEMIGRANRLLEAPAGFPIIENIYSGIRNFAKKKLGVEHIGLDVPDGSGGKMLLGFMKKYGVALPVAYAGYKTLDWMVDGSFLTKGTAFEEGLTTGIATIGVNVNKGISHIAEWTGGHWYREKQEEIAPGSTNLSRLLAFPLIGGLTATGGLYAIKTGKMAKMQWEKGISATDARIAVEKSMEHFGKGDNVFSRTARVLTQPDGIYNQEGLLGDIWRKIATPSKEGDLSFKFLRRMTPARLAGTAGILAGVALMLPFLPGALVPSERPDEMEETYSGRKEIAVRKGRGWEFGRSAWEGNKISYFRPHWYPRMRMNAREKSIWGDESESLSPIRKILKQEFTYELEQKHYYDRPYPISSPALEDVPILGPLLANTIGRVIKPPRLMHTEEWQGKGGSEQLTQPPRFEERIATEIGQGLPGQAENPYNITGTAGEQIYRMTELVGLPGFVASSLKESLTGSGDWFDQVSRLESSRRMFGFERKYWDLELGGGLGTTEAFRRLYPHRRRQIPLLNPIRNTMPEWLPGPGDKSPDFLHGDLYTKVPEGELRLPGEGYAARFPELEGINPENYPLIHKYKILADVAPYSTSFNDVKSTVLAARNTPNWTENEEYIYQQVQEQWKQMREKKTFDEYQYLSPMGEILGGKGKHYASDGSSELISSLNKINASDKPESGIFSKLFGGYWELLSHNAESTLEQLTPISPGAKLVHQRTAIEDYKRTQVYGTENAFWQHPVRDFIRPSTWLVAKAVGYKGIPTHIEKKRDIEEYFDILKYTKAARLANIARLNNDNQAVRDYENQKDKTLFGVNPFTMNYSSIFNALPRSERDYFNTFVAADTTDERQEILRMVPENERGLYIARWKMAFGDEVSKAAKEGLLNEKALGEAEDILVGLAQESASEGLPTSQELQGQYLQERAGGESYGDWYRRRYLLTSVPGLPGPDWIGFHPSVDLDDIKLKVVENIGEDIHSFDLWQTQAQSLGQKPYINQAAIEPILNPENLPREEMHARIDELLMTNKIKGSVFSRTSFGGQSGTGMSISIEQEEDTSLLKKVLGYGG